MDLSRLPAPEGLSDPNEDIWTFLREQESALSPGSPGKLHPSTSRDSHTSLPESDAMQEYFLALGSHQDAGWSTVPLVRSSLSTLAKNIIRTLLLRDLSALLFESLTLDSACEATLRLAMGRYGDFAACTPHPRNPHPGTGECVLPHTAKSSLSVLAVLLGPVEMYVSSLLRVVRAKLCPDPPQRGDYGLVPNRVIVAESLALDMIFFGVTAIYR